MIARRALLAAPLALAACGFRPALAPGSLGRVAFVAPPTRAGVVLVRRLQERLGPAGPDAPYRLDVDLDAETVIAAVDPNQVTTRVRLDGAAAFALRDASGAVLLRDQAQAFAAFDATGTVVSLDASGRDAEARLARLLADRIADRVLAAGLL